MWVVTTVVSGRNEAWDSPLYWAVAYPLALASSFSLGYFAPERPWRWALTLMLVQPVVMVLMTGGGSMLPLGLALFAILALPGVWLARLGARRRVSSWH